LENVSLQEFGIENLKFVLKVFDVIFTNKTFPALNQLFGLRGVMIKTFVHIVLTHVWMMGAFFDIIFYNTNNLTSRFLYNLASWSAIFSKFGIFLCRFVPSITVSRHEQRGEREPLWINFSFTVKYFVKIFNE